MHNLKTMIIILINEYNNKYNAHTHGHEEIGNQIRTVWCRWAGSLLAGNLITAWTITVRMGCTSSFFDSALYIGQKEGEFKTMIL